MYQKEIKIALVGNPNVGKTSLLNVLAKLKLHVGNWPGKTVLKKEAQVTYLDKKFRIIDLPGTYSLMPFTEEEKITANFIKNESDTDIVIQVIDANFLERNLFLFFEIISLKKKTIIALNFNREAKKNGVKINLKKIQKILKVPIIPIEANTGENINELLKAVLKIQKKKFILPKYVKDLKEEKNIISHHKAISFIKKYILPYHIYTKKRKDKNRKIDNWIFNKFTAFPIFLLSFYIIFKLAFVFANPLINLIHNFLFNLENTINVIVDSKKLSSFLTQGVLNGAGSVLMFVPLVFILFFLIAILEDSGYLARIVVLLDQFFVKFGVSGRFFIPMILGFSCNVPAILATRTIKNKRERLIAIFINPLISCSARLVVYGMFVSIFFPQETMLVIIFLYLLGVLVALIATLILVRLFPDNKKDIFIAELPPYRWPNLRNVFSRAWWQTRIFIKKAGSIIFVLILVVWFLASFPSDVSYASVDSWIGKIGSFISPVFSPLGFNHWIFSVAVLLGIVAKEAIIGTLGTLTLFNQTGINNYLINLITPLQALSFLVFISLYMPCLATLSVVKSETNSWKFVFSQMLFTFSIAWILSFIVYQIGKLII